MSAGIILTIGSFLYMILLGVVYISKQKLITVENKIFSRIMFINFIGLFLHIYLFVLMLVIGTDASLTNLIAKLYLVYLIVWITLFTGYVFVISSDKSKKILENFNKIMVLVALVIVIISVVIFILPIDFVNQSGKMYTYGPSVNTVYIISAFFIGLNISCLVLNIKKIIQKKYIPILCYLLLLVVVMIVQKNSPWIQLMTSLTSFIVYLMYFTIENPDMKMIEELIAARKLAIENNENQTMFIYNIVQKLRGPLTSVKEELNEVSTQTKASDIKLSLKEINNDINNMTLMINDVLDISNVNSDKINVVNTKYNLSMVLEELKHKYNKLATLELVIRFNISKNIPESLYGDSIRMKQVLNSLLSIALEHTASGYVELNITYVIKKNICRLFITVEDSANEKESKFSKNVVSDKTEELTKDKLVVPLDMVKKIVEYLGGTIMIESEKNVGTTMTVVIDQKIDHQSNGFTYNNIITGRKNVLLVAKNSNTYQTKMDNTLNTNNIYVDYTIYGLIAFNKIKNNNNYDLIIINDNIEKMSCLDTIKKLKGDANYDGKIMVIGPSDMEKTYQACGINKYLYDDIKPNELSKNVINELNKVENS